MEDCLLEQGSEEPADNFADVAEECGTVGLVGLGVGLLVKWDSLFERVPLAECIATVGIFDLLG